MLLRPDVLFRAWKKAKGSRRKVYTVLLSPQGKLLTHRRAARLAKRKDLLFICGHYEGVDQRFIDLCVDEEISIGNYVLTGGEVACLAVVDAMVRFIPGVLGNDLSAMSDSLQDGLLKYPQFTKPLLFEGKPVPAVLTSGNHQKIKAYRDSEKKRVTQAKRPELFNKWKRTSQEKSP